MAKRKLRAMSEKEVLKHYTPCDDAPLSGAPGAGARKMLAQIRASKPTFIKAVIAVDPVLSGRTSAVIRTAATKPKTRRVRKYGKTKAE